MDADILRKDIEIGNEGEVKTGFSEVTAEIEANVGVIDLHKMSVDKYYAHIERIKKLNSK